jgi:hypothetical protein
MTVSFGRPDRFSSRTARKMARAAPRTIKKLYQGTRPKSILEYGTAMMKSPAKIFLKTREILFKPLEITFARFDYNHRVSACQT